MKQSNFKQCVANIKNTSDIKVSVLENKVIKYNTKGLNSNSIGTLAVGGRGSSRQ